MKLKEAFTYPAGPVAVFDLIQDPAFRKKAVEATGGLDVEVEVEPHGDDVTITIVRSQPATVPDFIKSFVGETVRVKQIESWGPADAEGNRKASLKMSVQGQPAGMDGHATLKQHGTGASFVVDGDVKVKVPFVGKKIEPLIAKAVTAAVRHDVREGQKRL